VATHTVKKITIRNRKKRGKSWQPGIDAAINFSEEQLERILAAVSTVPAGINRGALREEIVSVAMWSAIGRQVSSLYSKQGQNEVREIRNTAQKLDRLLRHKPAIESSALRAALDEFLRFIDKIPDADSVINTRQGLFLRLSPFDFLVGEGLKLVFEDHFLRYPTSAGDYVRFATAVVEELGIVKKDMIGTKKRVEKAVLLARKLQNSDYAAFKKLSP
jgi:hypothetical protein